jgi:hypothetical protein
MQKHACHRVPMWEAGDLDRMGLHWELASGANPHAGRWRRKACPFHPHARGGAVYHRKEVQGCAPAEPRRPKGFEVVRERDGVATRTWRKLMGTAPDFSQSTPITGPDGTDAGPHAASFSAASGGAAPAVGSILP